MPSTNPYQSEFNVKSVCPVSIGFENAQVAPDYPYGFKLRCMMFYYLEARKGYGYRPVTQSTNPKSAVYKLNAAKQGNYTEVVAIYVEEGTGHLKFAHFQNWHEEKAEAFFDLFESGLTFEMKCFLKHCQFTHEAKVNLNTDNVYLIKAERDSRLHQWRDANKPSDY